MAPRKNRGGRPRKPDEERLGIQLALRLDPGLLERLDAHVARLQRAAPGSAWSRGAAIRELMGRALAASERPRLRELPKEHASAASATILAIVTEWDRFAGRPCPIFEVRRRRAESRQELDRQLLELERDGALVLERARDLVELAGLTAQDRAAAISHPERGLRAFVSVRRRGPGRAPS